MTDLPHAFKVVRTDRELEMPRVDARLREAGAQLVLLPDGTPEHELAREVADADLLLMCYARVSRQVIAGAGKLKAIIKYGVGIDAIDLDAAREHGIPVVNVPAYAEETVAEGAFALLMALFKRFKPIHQAMQQRRLGLARSALAGRRPVGQDAGPGGARARRALQARVAGAFGIGVLAYDPKLPASAMPPSVQRVDTLEALLQASDAVSVHCVLNAQTRHLLGAAQLAQMKRSAFLVNVSRGEIIDEAALLQALSERRIAGAALDVYGHEPPSRQGHLLSALYDMDNVMLWPHLSFYTHDAMQRLEDETLARCFEALRGQPLVVASQDPRLRAQTRGVRFVEGR